MVRMANETDGRSVGDGAGNIGHAHKPRPLGESGIGDVPSVPKATRLADDKGLEVLPEDEDREEFSGFRLTGRCVPAESWAQEIRGKGRQVFPLRRIAELKDERTQRDRVVVAVVFHHAHRQFETGEAYVALRLTDLAFPRPRLVTMWLRRKSRMQWSKDPNQPRRGAIVAVMNPTLEYVTAGSPGTLCIDQENAVLKLGDCPSLGRCQVKGCVNPCNADEKQRHCALHLSKTYASTAIRTSVAGGHSSDLMALLETDRRKRLRKERLLIEATQEDHREEDVQDSKRQKQVKQVMALSLDERRLRRTEANEDYVRQVCGGGGKGEANISYVPKLGRGLEVASDGAEWVFL